MSSTTNKQKKTIYETFDGVWRRILRDPHTGWTIILIFAAIITVSFVGVGYLARLKVAERLSSPSNVNVKDKRMLDKEELYKTLEVVQMRAAEHAALSKNYSGPSDPAK